jgi:DNA-binding HxlR family transcriptional regulator
VIEGRWKALIIFHLFSASVLRFSELRRAIAGISQKMLIQQLRDLETARVVARKVYPEVPPKVEYSLTRDGLGLCLALRALQLWAASRESANRKKKVVE